jgi:hypothetical protein
MYSPLSRRIMVLPADTQIVDHNVSGIIVGDSGENYDDTIFSAPSWIVQLDKNIDEYPEGTMDVLVTYSYKDEPNLIIIRKDSSIDNDHIEIVDKGGSKRRSRKSKKRRRVRRNKTLRKRRRRRY